MDSRYALLFLAAVGLSACGPASLAPVVTDADAIYDARLLGTWQDSAATETAVITEGPARSYHVLYTDSDHKTGRFDARLGALGSRRVLDFQPAASTSDASESYGKLLLRAHYAMFVDSIGAVLRLRQLDGDSIKKYLARNPAAIAHTTFDHDVLLTAPSGEVRRFLESMARRPGLLGDAVIWRRKPSPSPVGTQVVMLGSGTPNADPDRSGPAVAVVVNGHAYIVDAGPGNVRRAAAAAIAENPALRAANLDIVFLTHLHSDHTLGLPDLLLSPWVLDRSAPLRVFGPHGTAAMVDHISAAYAEDVRMRLTGGEPSNKTGYRAVVTEVDSGIVYRDSNVTVTAFRVLHGKWEEALGYKFVTSDRVIVISGDTRPSQAIVAQCNGCDVLVHEVYVDSTARIRSQAWRDYDKAYHTSTIELADLAFKARPKLLLLYHQLYRGATDDFLVRELKARYSGLVISARDLGVY